MQSPYSIPPKLDISKRAKLTLVRPVITPNGLGMEFGLAGFVEGRNKVCVREIVRGKIVEREYNATEVSKDEAIPAGYNLEGSMPPNAFFEKTANNGRRLVVFASWA